MLCRCVLHCLLNDTLLLCDWICWLCDCSFSKLCNIVYKCHKIIKSSLFSCQFCYLVHFGVYTFGFVIKSCWFVNHVWCSCYSWLCLTICIKSSIFLVSGLILSVFETLFLFLVSVIHKYFCLFSVVYKISFSIVLKFSCNCINFLTYSQISVCKIDTNIFTKYFLHTSKLFSHVSF